MANQNQCNTGYEYEAYSQECLLVDDNPEGCVSVRPCAPSGPSLQGPMTFDILHSCNHGYTYNPRLPISANCPSGCVNTNQQCDLNPAPVLAPGCGQQKVCMRNGQPAMGFVVGLCQGQETLFGHVSSVPIAAGCYYESTPRSCDRSPLVAGAHSSGTTHAGIISAQAEAMPRKFNGAADYVSVPKLGSYCDVTIDAWIKFGANALEPNCASLGAGWCVLILFYTVLCCLCCFYAKNDAFDRSLGQQTAFIDCPGSDIFGSYCVKRGQPAQPPNYQPTPNECHRPPQINHPIMNEDNWDEGDLHYQIYNGEFGFDINGNGDYVRMQATNAATLNFWNIYERDCGCVQTWKWQPGNQGAIFCRFALFFDCLRLFCDRFCD